MTTENKKNYIGIIVDLSKSMKKTNQSMKERLDQNEDYKKVLNRLEAELNRLKLFKKTLDTIYISILALGVHVPFCTGWPNIAESYIDRTYSSTWDLFKISNQLLRFKTNLEGLDKSLKVKWDDFSKQMIEEYKESLKPDSGFILFNNILNKIHRRVNTDFAYLQNRMLKLILPKKYFPKTIESIHSFFKERIENKNYLPEKMSQKFLSAAEKIVSDVFRLNGWKYREEIDRKFRDFIKESVRVIVRKSISTNDKESLLAEFSLDKLNQLKDEVSKYLYIEIKREFSSQLKQLDSIKFEIKKSLGVCFYRWEFKKELEDYVKFLSFTEITKLAEATIETIFKDSIEYEIKLLTAHNMEYDKYPVFLDAKNIHLSINEKDNTFFNYLAAHKLIFRSNDYYELVLHKYWNYFKDMDSETYDKYLLLVSDGGVYLDHIKYCEREIQALKMIGVKVIAAATLEQTMKPFPERNEINLKYADRFLFNSSSFVKDLPDSIAQFLKKRNPSISDSAKLLFSLNDENSLEQILTAIAEEEN